jgi:hypothetical protein
MFDLCLNINADEFWKQLVADDAPLSLVKFLEDRQEEKISSTLWANPASDEAVYME